MPARTVVKDRLPTQLQCLQINKADFSSVSGVCVCACVSKIRTVAYYEDYIEGQNQSSYSGKRDRKISYSLNCAGIIATISSVLTQPDRILHDGYHISVLYMTLRT